MNSKNHKVSIIVPCYNHEKYIESCIESIVKQTYKNIELIVLDDGSSDSSGEILLKLSKLHGFYFEQQSNMGLSATLNKGIQLSSGKYISIVASDDFFTHDKVEVLMNEMISLNEKYAVVCGDAFFVDDDGCRLSMEKSGCRYDRFISYYTAMRKDFNYINDFGEYSSLLKGNYIPVLSSIIDKNALIDVGLYSERFCLEDWDFWLRLSKKYKMLYVDKVVGFYRVHDSNSIKTMRLRLVLDMVEILEREKNYCQKNKLIPVWRDKYFSLIRLLLSLDKNYIIFFEKVIKNNPFVFLVYGLKKLFLLLVKQKYVPQKNG